MERAVVCKANALVEASYRLSLYEQRIVLACIAQVRRDEPLTDQHLYTVKVQEIAEMAGVGLKTAYRHLREASERLFERRVTLHETPNGQGGAKVRLTRWVQTVEYREAEGMVSLRFGTDMVPYLTQLTEQFTRYPLDEVAQLKSPHAIRFYELLCQWRNTGKREVALDWLREALQLEARYQRLSDLKRWVIEPAVEQINEHTSLNVKWEQRKTGRRVTHLVFMFGEKPKTKKKAQQKAAPAKQPTEKKNPGFTDEEIAKAARPGETWEQTQQRLEEERRRRIDAARDAARSVVGLARHE
ncbi:replication initiation protein [Serratia ficaria]|nr:replication initiation protein [Enterobacter mori]MEE4449998.1 replication initiation protein [Serratia sp. C2(1)]MEE4486007.1 replication initiation protein [Serratia ficaria]